VIRFEPTARGMFADQLAVPLATPKVPVVLFTQVTEVTDMSSVAVPKTVPSWVVEVKLGRRLGSITSTGGIVSNEKFTVSVADPIFPKGSDALIVMRFAPGTSWMEAVQFGAAKVAWPLAPVRLFDQETCETAVLSVAVPEMTSGRI